MTKKNDATICALPWIGTQINTNGTLSPCCFSTELLKGKDGKVLSLHKDSLADALTSPTLQNLKKNLMNGIRDKSCERCWACEKAELPSRRTAYNEIFSKEVKQIQKTGKPSSEKLFLGLKLGNLCNQKCRVCGPGASSLWAAESLKMNGQDGLPRLTEDLRQMPLDESRDIVQNWQVTKPDFLQEVKEWIPTLKHYNIAGGEPFLTKGYYDILLQAVKTGVSKHQRITIISNCSVFPEQYVKNIFPYFKSVEVLVSLDGYGDQFEYQRHPANWKRTFENYKKLKQTPYFGGIALTISALNVYYMPEYLEFWDSLGENKVAANYLIYPDYLSVRILPKAIKAKIGNKLFTRSGKNLSSNSQAHIDHVTLFMLQEDHSRYWNQFIHTVKSIDKHRGESFEKVFPEFIKICGDAWPS